MRWAILDPNSQVINFIVYDGTAEFSPPDGCTVAEVNDWVQLGQPSDTPEPALPVVVAPAPVIPDLATQLAAALINGSILPASALATSTLAAVNKTLSDAKLTVISAAPVDVQVAPSPSLKVS